MKSLLPLALVLLFFLAGRADAGFYGEEETGSRVEDSIGALYRRDFTNSLHFTCTVSALEKGSSGLVVLTANHCVSEYQKYYYVTFDGLQFYLAETYKIPREKPEDPEVDMALLKIKDYPEEVPLLNVSGSSLLSGDDIVTVGFPLGISKILYKGYIAGQVTNRSSGLHGYLILQIFGASGSSGTAVLDLSDKSIVGVLVAASTARIGLPVIYATPISYLKYLVTPAEKREMVKDGYEGVD